MEMNSHESRRVSEMARVSDDLLGTGGLAVHQFNSSTGRAHVRRTVISAAEVPRPFLPAVRLSQVTGTRRAALSLMAVSRKLLNDSECPLGGDTS